MKASVHLFKMSPILVPTVVHICQTSLRNRHINADCAFFSPLGQYLISVEYIELGFANVTVAMGTHGDAIKQAF